MTSFLESIIKSEKTRPWQIAVIVTLSILLAFTWAVGLDREWGTDYGVYYVGARFLSSDYRLYQEHFDHKGPVYYAFLRMIGAGIGYGPLQAIVSLFFTTLFFSGTLLWVASKYSKSPWKLGIVALIGGAVLVFQPSNASISLVQTSLLICAFHFLYQNMKDNKKSNLYLSFVFLALAILTRIDSVIFSPMYLFTQFSGGSTWKAILTAVAVGVLIFAGLYGFFALIFGFSLEQYYIHNIHFNQIYRHSRGPELLYFWYRPETFKLLLISGIPSVLLLALPGTINKYKLAFLFFLPFMGLLGFLFTNSDKNFHLFILYPPLLFVVIALHNVLDLTSRYKLVILLLLLLYPNILLSSNLIGFVVDVRDGAFPSLKSENDIQRVKLLSDMGEGYGIFERSWIFLYADLKPELSLLPAIYDDRYTAEADFFRLTGLSNLNTQFLEDDGTVFLMSKEYLHDPNLWMDELLKNSCLLEEVGRDQLRMVGKCT